MSHINDTLLDTVGADAVPRVLVANKADLEADVAVGKAEGQRLAAELGCPFLYMSARTDGDVSLDSVFQTLLLEVDGENGSGVLPDVSKEAA